MLRLGYHPATYVRQDVSADDALAHISATGWDGFEWSPGGLARHYDVPGTFKENLDALDLEVSGIYCFCSFTSDEEIARWRESIDSTIGFAKQIGSQFVLIDGGSTDLPANSESIDRIAGLANQAGKRITDAGLTCTWHQHWGTLFQYAAEFDALMAATDPELVRCTPDTAQMALGDFDIPAAFDKYLPRMDYVHFKDLDADRRFIELGHGQVDFPPLARTLREEGFDGWVVVDLDYTSLDPRESSPTNLRYVRSTLGLTGRRQ